MADGIRVIHTVTRFCMELRVGDVFWHMTTSSHGEPYTIEGPCTILNIFIAPRTQSVMVRYARSWSRETEDIVEDAIKDLVNLRHGVFLNAPDAAAYFDERRRLAQEKNGQAHLACHFLG